MNQNNQLLCVWMGPIFALLFGLGFWLFAQFIPHAPSASAQEIADIYRANTAMIRLGQLILLLAGSLAAAFVAVISVQLRRIETRHPAFTYTQLVAGTVAVVLLVLPALVWTMAAFRPERAPELTQMLNDAAWILILMPFAPAFVQVMAIGLAILGDKARAPVFPRWAGFFNIWIGVLFLPGGLITFFKSGPFAWNGLFGFWIPVIAFFTWVFVMTTLMIRSIKQQAAE